MIRAGLLHGPFHRAFHSSAHLFARSSSSSNYYSILELDGKQDCSAKDIKSKFYELSMRYHPDKNPNNDSSHEKFLKISEAYSVLGNELKRKEYDREMKSTHSGPYGGGGGFSGYTGGRMNTQEWSSRSYREKLRPDDYILYRRKEGAFRTPGSRPGFNFKAHHEGHYGMGSSADSFARKRMYERQYYRELYEQRSWRNSIVPFIFLVGSTITLLFSDFFKLLWM